MSDPSLLVAETHRFESTYLDSLIAPWPEGAAEYELRSPMARLGSITASVLVFQGEEDRVVPGRSGADAGRGAARQGDHTSSITSSPMRLTGSVAPRCRRSFCGESWSSTSSNSLVETQIRARSGRDRELGPIARVLLTSREMVGAKGRLA